MSGRTYATFDPLFVPAGNALSQGNLIVAADTGGSFGGSARSTVAVSDFFNSVEILFYSPDGSKYLPDVPYNAIGIVFNDPANFMSSYLGFSPFAIGWRGSGQIWNGAQLIATIAGWTYDDWLRIDLDLVSQTVSFFKNGTLAGTLNLANLPVTGSNYSGQAWKYACNLYSQDINMAAFYANPGVTPMRYPPGAAGDAKPGWYSVAPSLEALMLGTEHFIGKSANDWPNPGGLSVDTDEKYHGVIDADKSPMTLYDSVHFLPWGQSAPGELGSGGLIQMQINDPKQQYDALLADNAKGAKARLVRARSNDSIDNAKAMFTGMVDHVVQDSLYTKQVYIRDRRDLLNVAISRALYAPNLDPAVAMRPRSCALGIVRTRNPELVSATAKWYGGHDARITAFGTVRYAGVPKVLGVDYNASTDGAGIVTTTTVPDQITLETTSIGSAFNPVAPDYLTARGDFTACGFNLSTHVPNYWTDPWAPYAIDLDYPYIETLGGQKLKCASMPGFIRGMTLDSPLLHAGRTYAYKFHCDDIPNWGYNVSVGRYVPPAKLYLTDSVGNFIGRYYVAIALDHVGDYVGVFTVPYNVDSKFGLLLEFNDLAYGTDYASQLANALAFNYLTITKITLNEQAAIADGVTLDGPGLDTMLQQIMILRGPLDPEDYDSTGAQGIDALTPWKVGTLVRMTETPTVEQVVRPVLNSFLADLVNKDEDGRFTAVQMFAPEDKSAVGTLRHTDVFGELLQYPDMAENLSDRACGRKNWDPISLNDMAQSDKTFATISQQTRSLLSIDYQWTVSSGIKMAERYRECYNAEPIQTLLDLQADGQAFITKLNNLYKFARNFYVGEFKWKFARDFKLMDVWNLIYPMYGLDAGRNLVIVGRQRQPTRDRCRLIWWGL